MSVSPAHLQIVISGPQVLKCYSIGPDNTLRSSSLLHPSKESETFVDHKWLPQSDALHRLFLFFILLIFILDLSLFPPLLI